MSRFVVRELEGFAIRQVSERRTGGKSVPGLTVWVADEAYYGREVKVWRSEGNWTGPGRPRALALEIMRAEARALADRLNSEDDDD